MSNLIAKMKVSEMTNLPDDWEVKNLGDICEFFNGKGHEKHIDPQGQFVVVNSKFISSDGAVFKKSKKAFTPLRKNDIAMVMSDIPNGKAIAKCFIVDEENKFTLNQRIGGIRIIKEDIKYIYYLLNRNSYYLLFDDGLGQTNLRKEQVLGCPLYLPPLPEQQKISEILSTVDQKIEIIEERINQTQELKKGLMQQFLTKGIGHTKFKDSTLGKIPASWDIVKLGDISSKVTDGSHFSPVPTKGTGFYIATVKDMNVKGFDLEKCAEITEKDFISLKQNGCQPERNDILFSKDGTIGKTFVFDGLIDIVLLSSIAIIKIKSDTSPDFICQILKSNIFYQQLEGLKSGSAIRRLVLKAIKEIKIPLPPFNEQQRIETVMSSLDTKIQVLNEKKSHYQDLKKGLMQQLLTGKKRVQL